MERNEQLRVVEALILGSPDPLTPSRIAQITPDCTPSLAKDLVAELNEAYEKEERAFEVWEVAGGYQFRTRAEFSGYLQQLQKDRPLRLSRAALETLAIVAYKQPATRADVENVRGVDVGATLKSLMDRGLVKISGHKEVPGRPMIYATTRRFLEVFGLDALGSLPALRELEELAREQGLGEEGSEEGDGEGEVEAVGDAEAASEGAEEGEGEERGAVSFVESAGGDLSEEAAALIASEPIALEDDADELEAIDASLAVDAPGFESAQADGSSTSTPRKEPASEDSGVSSGDAEKA